MTTPGQQTKQIAKMLTYVLGRKPDEFGLIPDTSGFVPIKALLQALHEEDGWRHIRFSHLQEVSLNVSPSPIDIRDNMIRALDRSTLPRFTVPIALPKLLYTAVRRRAYPTVMEKGVSQGPIGFIILADNPVMAKRLGFRVDNHPIVITIQTEQSQTIGACYQQFGETLYTTDRVFPGTFTGPPLPKDPPQKQKKEKQRLDESPQNPGSFFPQLVFDTVDETPKTAIQRSSDKKARQKERRLARKQKNRLHE